MITIKSQSILAKIIAAENIRLVVNETMDTASFDLKNRIVRVPEKMFGDDQFRTMVIGHEIAHCLYTPYDEFIEFREEVKRRMEADPTNTKLQYAMSANNIIEDVRIDRLIQIRYPGLKKYYKSSVSFIWKEDFFKVKGKDVNTLSFLNRLCIYSKADLRDGPISYGVKFSAEEQPYVDRALKADTFKEVCDLTFEILEKFDVTAINSLDESESEESEKENSGEGQGQEGNGKGERGQGGRLPDRMNVDEEMLGEGGNGDDKDKTNITTASDKGGNEKLLIDVWNNKVSDERSSNVAVSHSLSGKQSVKVLNVPDMTETVPFFEEGRNNYRARSQEPVDKNKANNYVNKFANSFMMKKRARELMKTFEADSGVLDVNKLYRYKFDDKIFKSSTIENKQKNHGFIFLVDCSGSMSDIFGSVITQLYMFQKICKRISVPHYAFGYTTGSGSRSSGSRANNFDSDIALYNFFNTGMKNKDVDENFEKLFDGNIYMGGTPTSEALLRMIPYAEKMRNETHIDILNLVVITDGADGTSMNSNYLSYKGGLVKQEYSPRGVIDNTAGIYNILRDHCGVRVTHIDITSSLPASFLDNKELYFFEKEGYLAKSEFGGADNVFWITENTVTSTNMSMINNFTNMLA